MKALITLLSVYLFGFTHSLYSPSDSVVELNPSNFDQKVINGDGLWLVEFYAPWCGHCQSLAPEWKKAAKALKGVVNVAAVDADAHKQLGGRFSVQGFPTIKIFGANKNQPQDYNGPRTAAGIVDNAMSQLRSLVNARLSGGGSKSGGGSGGGSGGNQKDVIELTDANFESSISESQDIWLVEFYAPWCGHCKNLAPHWASAATQLKGKVKVAAVDATVHNLVAQKYGIKGFPTIKVFPAGVKDMENPQDYDGGRTGEDIVSYANNLLAESLPPPEIVELTNDEKLKECTTSQICIIAFLPHILDCQSSCRNNYLEVLSKMGDKFKKHLWGWSWTESLKHEALEKAVGVGGFGYPALVAVHSKKGKYVLMTNSFSNDGVNEFLRGLSFGKNTGLFALIKDSKLPELSTVEAWDGKDGELSAEEEIDLSDVELEPLEDLKKDEL